VARCHRGWSLHSFSSFLVLLYRVLFDEFHIDAGVLYRYAFLAAGHFNGDPRLYIARGRRSLRLGRRCRRILGGHLWSCHHAGGKAKACKKNFVENSMKWPNSIVHGTAGLGQVSPHSDWMPLTPEVLPRRCSAVETPGNRHLTHLYSSCKFSRNCPAGKMGTLQD